MKKTAILLALCLLLGCLTGCGMALGEKPDESALQIRVEPLTGEPAVPQTDGLELYELSSGVSNAYREMSGYEQNVRETLQASGNRINSSHEYIIHSMEIQAEIDRLYARFKNMELANKKIRECNRKKQYEFANYTAVRKIVPKFPGS